MKTLLRIIFTTLSFASIFLIVISYCNREWETITASISLTVAIISGWIASEVFIRQNEANRPQIIIRLDFKSRNGLVLLVIENLGKRPAFNIKLNWDKPLKNLKNENVTFNNYDNNNEIKVLNAKELTSVIIDNPLAFFNKNKPDNLDYSGTITFSDTITSNRESSYPFFVSFKHYGLTPNIESEEAKMILELQKLPTKLDEIKIALQSIEKLIKQN